VRFPFLITPLIHHMEKMKVYLDTNMILDVFINQAKAVRGTQLPLPSKYQFMLDHLDTFHFLTSVLTMAEVARELLTAYHCTKEQIMLFWSDFIDSLACQYITEFVVSQNFLDVVFSIPMKLRTMMNFQHIFIAMKENAYFLSGDKDIIRLIRKNKLYDKALTYIELRRMVSPALSSSSPP